VGGCIRTAMLRCEVAIVHICNLILRCCRNCPWPGWPAQVRELKAQGLGATEIAQELGIDRASVYRVLEAS
jgi:hypothetical protein